MFYMPCMLRRNRYQYLLPQHPVHSRQSIEFNAVCPPLQTPYPIEVGTPMIGLLVRPARTLTSAASIPATVMIMSKELI